MVERIATIKHCGECPKYNECKIRNAVEIPDECPLPTADELRNLLKRIAPLQVINTVEQEKPCNYDALDGARTEP